MVTIKHLLKIVLKFHDHTFINIFPSKFKLNSYRYIPKRSTSTRERHKRMKSCFCESMMNSNGKDQDVEIFVGKLERREENIIKCTMEIAMDVERTI